MSKDELLKIVTHVLSVSHGDKQEAIRTLDVMCSKEDEMLFAFAKHGNEIMQAMMQKQTATLQ